MKSKKIFYSKFKISALLYTKGEHIVEIFENDTLTLTAPTGKSYQYNILNVEQERNDMLFTLDNPRSGLIGYFKLMPLGKAELVFEDGRLVKLKV